MTPSRLKEAWSKIEQYKKWNPLFSKPLFENRITIINYVYKLYILNKTANYIFLT